MSSLTSATFSRSFSLVLDSTNSGRRSNNWLYDHVEFRLERLSYSGPDYTLRCEVYRVTQSAEPAWRLLYVMETWWDEAEKSVVRESRWGKLLGGTRADVISWFPRKAEALSL